MTSNTNPFISRVGCSYSFGRRVRGTLTTGRRRAGLGVSPGRSGAFNFSAGYFCLGGPSSLVLFVESGFVRR